MIEGVTSSGFSYSISEETLDDYELLEALCRVDKGEVIAIVDVVDLLLGEAKNTLKQHVKTHYGHTSSKELIKEITEILQGSKKGKNS